MKTIQINRTKLITELTTALEYAGSTDWDVYVDMNGNVDTRHNTHENGEYLELIDLYGCVIECDEKYPGDDGYDYEEAAAWIVNEYELNDSEDWDEEESTFVTVNFELID